jgi:hypothetical protein
MTATEDLSDDDYERIVNYAVGWLPESGPVDWDDLLYRIEGAFDLDLGGDMNSPVIKRIKREVRRARRDSQ